MVNILKSAALVIVCLGAALYIASAAYLTYLHEANGPICRTAVYSGISLNSLPSQCKFPTIYFVLAGGIVVFGFKMAAKK